MLILKIVKIENNKYTFVDKNNVQYVHKMKFYGVVPKIGNGFVINENLFDDNYCAYCFLYSFKLVDDFLFTDLNGQEEYVGLVTKTKKIVLQRVFG